MARTLPALCMLLACTTLGCKSAAGPAEIVQPVTHTTVTSTTTSSSTTSSTATTSSTTTTSSSATTRPTIDCTVPLPLVPSTPTSAGPWIHDAAGTRFLGRGPEEWGGFEAGNVGDVNADGHDDLLLASQLSSPNEDDAGMAWLFYGPVATGDVYLSCADLVLQGENPGDRLGTAAASAGDLTGDGLPDVAVSAHRAPGPQGGGEVYVFEADAPGSLVATDAHARLVAPNKDSMAGYDGLAGGDLTGDGTADLLIPSGQPHNTGGALAWIASGPMAGDISLDAEIRFVDAAIDHAGNMGVAVADWTGDGQLDALLALGASGSGARLYAGPITADVDVNAYDGRVVDPDDSYMHHVTDAGDVDGDGNSDVVLCGAYYALGTGRCAVVHGPIVGDHDVADSPWIIGETEGGLLGETLAAGDFDGDGFSDVVVAESQRSLYPRSGTTLLFLGPISGQHLASEADLLWVGAFDYQLVGSGLANVGDVDGDGLPNLLVGASGDTGPSPDDAGSWYLVDPTAL